MRKPVLLTIVLALAIPAVSANKKVAPDLARDGKGPVDVIIQFRTPPNQKHYDKVRTHGGTVTQELSLVNGLEASMPRGQVDHLATDPDVVYISPNRVLAGRLNN